MSRRDNSNGSQVCNCSCIVTDRNIVCDSMQHAQSVAHMYIGVFVRKDRFMKCNMCKIKIDFQDYKYKNFFVMMDPSSHISLLIKSNNDYHTLMAKERVYKKVFFMIIMTVSVSSLKI